MKKNNGTMIIVSTPSSPNRHLSKAMSMAAAYGASPDKLKGAITNGIWMDEMPFWDDLTWWTKDGRPMQIANMGTEHIKNCLTAISEGKIRYRERFVIPMKKELARRNSKLGEILYGSGLQQSKTVDEETSELAGKNSKPKRRTRKKAK